MLGLEVANSDESSFVAMDELNKIQTLQKLGSLMLVGG